MSNEKNNPTQLIAIMSMSTAFCLYGCGPGEGGSDPTHQENLGDPRQLAEKYVLEELTESSDVEALLTTIRSLDEQNLLDFAWWVVEYQQVDFEEGRHTDDDDLLILAMADHAAKKGMPFFDLTEDEVREISPTVFAPDEIQAFNEEPQALCIWPWKSCQYTTAWNDTVQGLNYIPASGWITGYASDRTSNSACEEFDCDHRLAYDVGATARNNYFARTAAALCVQNAYPSLLTYKSGTTQFTLVGYYKTNKCGIVSGAYLRQNLALW